MATQPEPETNAYTVAYTDVNRIVNDKNYFSNENALAMLLLSGEVFTNSHWWEKDWPKKAQDSIGIYVNCNDIFAWASADAEDLPLHELENLFNMWKKDPKWGTAIWCCIQRNQMPQKPAEDLIRKDGIWNLDEYNLRPNEI